jgi:hypothetical protein
MGCCVGCRSGTGADDNIPTAPIHARKSRPPKAADIVINSAYIGTWAGSTYGERESIEFQKDRTFIFSGEYKDASTQLDVPKTMTGMYSLEGNKLALRIEHYTYSKKYGDSAYAQEVFRNPVSVEIDTVEVTAPNQITITDPTGKKQVFKRKSAG